MKKRLFVCFVAVLGFLYVSGCSRPAAVVNGKKIDMKTFDILLKEKVQEHKDQKIVFDMKQMKNAVIQELIAEKLMLEEAEKRGIKISDEDVNTEMDLMKKNVGEDAFYNALKEKGVSYDDFSKRTKEKMAILRFSSGLVNEDSITEEEIESFYKNSPVPFIKPKRVLMRIIEFSTEEAANAVVNEMKNRKIDFDAMAKKLENDDRALTATEYGWVNPELFSSGIAQAVRELKPGQSGGPYKGKQGFFLVKVNAKESEGVAKIDDVRHEIKKTLFEQKKNAAIAQWVEQHKKESKIQINIK
jgi:foldase protein PrsA